MKLRHLFSAAVLTIGLCATSAQAKVLNLTELLKFSDGGFTSSLIHDQRWDRMSGARTGIFDSAITGGTYDTVTGAIQFAGTIYKWGVTSSFTAVGNLMASPTRTDGLYGNIEFSFTGDLLNRTWNFLFEDKSYTAGEEPNGFASNGTYDYIALWGDRGNYSKSYCDAYRIRCQGIDLRIAFEEGGAPGGVIPLPASWFLLLAGVGGLGVARKLRKKV